MLRSVSPVWPAMLNRMRALGRSLAPALWLLPLSVATLGAPAHAAFLHYAGIQRDGIGGVAGLRGALAAALSPDGAHLYTTSSDDNAVAVFRRNALVGRLTFVQARFDGVGGVDGLNGLVGTSAVTVSPDGAHVYTASASDSAVTVFRRNSATGALMFVEALFDGVGAVDGLNGAWGLAVSPDGEHLYVGSAFDRAVAAFRRDSTTGALMFIEAQFDGVAGVGGLDDP